jgi:uridine phosphorylase
MEKLIVLGAKRIWVLGWCGALHADLQIGHILIPTAAVSEEGTSAHYPISDRPIASTERLNLMLEEALKQTDLPFSKGTVWTTDALYRETPEKVKTHKKSGVLAVEMEMSALMTLAIYRSVAMAGLLVVSDQLFDLAWRPGFAKPVLRERSRAAGEILLHLADSLSGS